MKKQSLLIAEPMYDTVFKRLMENERVAKFLIGTILDVTVVGITVRPIEYTYDGEHNRDELKDIKLYRLDFIAVIRTESGELVKVLIEIQKAKNKIDLMRFRNYLGEQYKWQEVIDGKKTALPIVTIYILGFNLQDIDSACIKVNRAYLDLVNNVVIDSKNEFIEKLTHDCYIVQTKKIAHKYNTKLDKLLSLFAPNYYTDNSMTVKEYKHDIDMEEIQIMTDILHHSATNDEERRKIEIEREAQRTFDFYFGDILTELEEYKKSNQEKDKSLEEKDKSLEEKDKSLEEIKKALEEKDRIIAELKRNQGKL